MTSLDVPQPELPSSSRSASAGTSGAAEDRADSRVAAALAQGTSRPWILSTVGLALLGSLMMWLALPPVNLWPLAWVAPVCWLTLVRRPRWDVRRPYLKIYLAGLAFWLAAVYWLTLPHWSTCFAWASLSGYLAFYVPLFVALCRVSVYRLRLPLVIAAPVIWTALELVRGHFGGGFLMATLGHTQYQWIGLIQISDLVGAYGVSFLVMFVAACFSQMLPIAGKRLSWWPAVPLAAAMVAVLAYGNVRLSQSSAAVAVAEGKPAPVGPTIALVQGTIDTEFGGDAEQRAMKIYTQYRDLTVQTLRNAKRQNVAIDLVVWPESMFPYPLTMYDGSRTEQPSLSPETANGQAVISRTLLRQAVGQIRMMVADKGNEKGDKPQPPTFSIGEPDRPRGPALLFGADTRHYKTEDSRPTHHSTSIYVDPAGEVIDHYNKMHPVMFGEYVPLGNVFPALYNLTPLPGGLSAGEGPVAFDVAGVTVAPNICYETVIPHLIRRQVAELAEHGEEPAVLITQTNDGWFWGSAALDMHLICGVFRAIECRKPLLISANTGITAWVDADGRLVEQCERRKEQVIVARPQLDERKSLYVRAGDWFGWSCVVLTGLVVPFAWRRRQENETAPAREE